MKPIVVSGREFGEVYHLAVALALDDSCKAILVKENLKGDQQFLQLFSDRVSVIPNDEYEKNKNKGTYVPAGCSTDVYCRKWGKESGVQLKNIVLNVATDNQTEEVRQYLENQIEKPGQSAVLVWIRNRLDYQLCRNSTEKSTKQLLDTINQLKLKPILVGNKLGPFQPDHGNLIEFYNSCPFKGSDNSRLLQLLLFHLLHEKYRLVASVGMMSGGMDGPALLMGVPTVSLAKWEDSERICKIEKAIKKHYHVVPLAEYPGRYSDCDLETLSSLIGSLR